MTWVLCGRGPGPDQSTCIHIYMYKSVHVQVAGMFEDLDARHTDDTDDRIVGHSGSTSAVCTCVHRV